MRTTTTMKAAAIMEKSPAGQNTTKDSAVYAHLGVWERDLGRGALPGE